MPLRHNVKGGVLSTVMVVAVLMLLVVFAVIALWDADFLLFSRANHLRVQRANIESTFTLYANHPRQVMSRLDADSTILLFDSQPASRMKVTQKAWGLYEVVTVETADGRARRSGIFGLRQPHADDCVLWYRNDNGAVTVTGRSHIGGVAYLPDNGLIYGQMQSVFFDGERLPLSNIRKSGEAMPPTDREATRLIAELFALGEETAGASLPDSITVSFHRDEAEIISTAEIYDNYLAGQVIITGGRVDIRSDAALWDVLVVADEIRVEDGFRGSVQLFARDSVLVGRSVELVHPSGIYAEKYAALGDGSMVNGYLIVNYTGEEQIMQPVCRKSRLSRVRGLFYCSGIAQFQGITSGGAYLWRSIYYSPQGYYSDFLYDVSLLENRETAYPFWFAGAPHERMNAKWVR